MHFFKLKGTYIFLFSYVSTKTYVVGAHNVCGFFDKKETKKKKKKYPILSGVLLLFTYFLHH